MKARIPNQGGNSQANMMKKIQDMQNEMARVQQEVEESEFEACSGGGAVEVTMTGRKSIKNLVIKPEVVDPDDIETLQDLIMVAVNDAVKQADDMMTEGMSELTGGLNIPGLF